jgi:hypothetical protein
LRFDLEDALADVAELRVVERGRRLRGWWCWQGGGRGRGRHFVVVVAGDDAFGVCDSISEVGFCAFEGGRLFLLWVARRACFRGRQRCRQPRENTKKICFFFKRLLLLLFGSSFWGGCFLGFSPAPTNKRTGPVYK